MKKQLLFLFMFLFVSSLFAQSYTVEEGAKQMAETLTSALKSKSESTFLKLATTAEAYNWFIDNKVPAANKKAEPQFYEHVSESDLDDFNQGLKDIFHDFFIDMNDEGITSSNLEMVTYGYITGSNADMVSHVVQVIYRVKTGSEAKLYRIVLYCMQGPDRMHANDIAELEEIVFDE